MAGRVPRSQCGSIHIFFSHSSWKRLEAWPFEPRWIFILLGLTFLLPWTTTIADLQSDAGCHSSLYVNTYNLSQIADLCPHTVLGANQESISFFPQYIPETEQTGDDTCGGPSPHLFAFTCPHAALSDASQCTQTDTCPLVEAFPADPARSFAQEYYVQAAVASEAHFYVLTTDTSVSTIRIYRCTLDLTSCIVADVPSSIPAIYIAGPPSLGATLTPDGGPATMLHITYESWAPDASVAVPYVMWIMADIGLSSFTLVNVSQITNAPYPGLYSHYAPYPSVVRNYLHIATQEYIVSSASVETVVIYSCDWAIATCTRRSVPIATPLLVLSGPALAHWPLNDYLYVAYNQNLGPYSIGAITRCALSATGDLDDTNLCADSQFPSDGVFDAYGTPSIAFADYLGAVVVAYVNLEQAGLWFLQYDADFSGDAKLYSYLTPLADQVGAELVNCPAIFDIDPSTTLMRLAYGYTVVAGTDNLLVGELDAFPSQLTGQSPVFFSPGYAKWYPPPLRQECLGTEVDVVASCPAVLVSGVCTQAWLFSGGDLAHPYFEVQPCYPKQGYGLQAVYPRASNPNSQYACIYLDDSNPSLTYFDDGPSIPLVADAILDVLLGQIPMPPTPSTDLSTIVASVLPDFISSTDSLLGAVNPGLLFAATSTRLTFWGGGRAHDYCYHNTVHYPGFDKDMCDAMVYKRWALACVDSIATDIFDIIIDLAEGYFPGESIIECEALAFLYYVVLRTSNAAQQAYLASNSNVDSSQFSNIPDGLGDFSGNNAPDPSLIKQNAELINSTIYTDTDGTLKANLAQYSALLLSNPLIPSPAPPPAPFPPGFAVSPAPAPLSGSPTTPTPAPTAPPSVLTTPLPTLAPALSSSPSAALSPSLPIGPMPVASPTPVPTVAISSPTAVPIAVVAPVPHPTSSPVQTPIVTLAPVASPTLAPTTHPSPVTSSKPIGTSPPHATAIVRPVRSPTMKPAATQKPVSPRTSTPLKPASVSERTPKPVPTHKPLPASKPARRHPPPPARKPARARPMPKHTTKPLPKPAKAKPATRRKPVGHKLKPIRRPPTRRAVQHHPAPAPHKPAQPVKSNTKHG